MSFWSRLGITVVALALFVFGATYVFGRYPELQAQKKIIAGCLAGAGTLLWLLGKVHGNNVDTTAKVSPIFTCTFCGTIIALCGGIVAKFEPISQFVASPDTLQKITSIGKGWPQFFAKGSHTTTRRRNDAPGSLRIQGIFYRDRGASAIINGQTVGVGDHVGAARVVAIERQSVTIEIADQKKVLTL